ncbi:hypothetical protein B566_EDAN003547 [Ephemera danica]|nr:hypothetical protein B566_EDAN003547 [Ephemera danica]
MHFVFVLNMSALNELKISKQIESVVITSEELSSVNANIKCTEKNCFMTFKSSSNLNMHLTKHHQIHTTMFKKRSPGVEVRYHCPELDCKYSSASGMSFKRTSLLKQHYLKVHAVKDFVCEKCNKGFATQAIKNYHSQTCGMNFVCSCGITYTSREALLTHAKRKQHDVSNQTMSPGKIHPDGRKSLAEAFPIHFLAAVALSELSERSKPITREIGIQTEADLMDCRHKRKSISPVRSSSQSAMKLLGKRKASTQTQTLAPKKLKTSTETQTIGDIILRKAMQNANIPVRVNKRGNKKHSETQTLRKNHATKQNETQTSSFEPSSEIENHNVEKSQDLQNELKNANLTEIEMDIQFIESQTLINDASLPDVWLNQKSTQTTPTPFFFANQFSIDNLLTADDKFQSSETQTELAAEYGSDNFLDDCDTNFTLCSNIETQTELNESIEEMLHSHMYTQTCDELLLDFVDIQTQTWPNSFSPNK